MKDHVYKYIEIVGTSTETIEKAIKNALKRASATLDGIHWFEVTETRGCVKNGKVDHYQVSMKVGFTLRDPK